MRTLAVIGTAGGVGTTTLAALAFAGLRAHPAGAPMLYARPSSHLLERAGGDEVAAINGDLAIWDAGPHTPQSAAALLEAGGCVLAVAAPATPLGVSDAGKVLTTVAELGEEWLASVTVVLSGVTGRGPGPAASSVPPQLLIRVPFDRSLARPQPLPPLPRLGRRTRAAALTWQQRAASALGI